MKRPAHIIVGDARVELPRLPAESADCCVTSPPYWGLRDYGVAGQIGIEASIDLWVAELVAVLEEVRRILKPHGTLWLNLGDAYNAGGRGGNPTAASSTLQGSKSSQEASIIKRYARKPSATADHGGWTHNDGGGGRIVCGGLKSKDLIGQPWMVAFALRAAGWYLRSDIIWHKPNPMPESVTDRPTKAHEYVFLLSKGSKYFFDAEAIAEPVTGNAHPRGNGVNPKARLATPAGWDVTTGDGGHGSIHRNGTRPRQNASFSAAVRHTNTKGKHSGEHPQSYGHRLVESVAKNRLATGNHDRPFGDTRNARTVWTIPTQAYSGAHFATFPRELAARCIKAGCPAGGLVLDPFVGTGTTVAEAVMLGRRGLGVELNPKYARLAEARIHEQCGLLAHGGGH